MLRLLGTARPQFPAQTPFESAGLPAVHEAARAEHSDKTP